jgi:hypothetical protein
LFTCLNRTVIRGLRKLETHFGGQESGISAGSQQSIVAVNIRKTLKWYIPDPDTSEVGCQVDEAGNEG